ncbi:carbamoyl-phosphate synthase subunit L [Alsobacter sp. SYSU M60028]|uniref:Carbamoyl-phosphate synthase subunit L n=1 Tax=Alsobacter ponti TaxID=2962936 RepID=A0ABT1LI35_9HYPH|nr:biotin carboxylase N-terminal domain-containing protein [Alsobacter ponti]MCP8939888.1 carbamoyl-phosphate synthase subunit L [Alsobacter ponti]
MFSSVLIANRGEIACRVIRTARRLGLRTIAVYSDADRDSLFVAQADEAHRIGPAPAGESYLIGDRIVAVAKEAGADCIHPGYGFLSENAEFAEACAKAGIAFVGPPPKAIRAMGLKDAAKAVVERAGVPVVPGYHGAKQDPAFLRERAANIGFPVLIKAVAGGGGKGMRRVDRLIDFEDALLSAQREAANAFGDPRVLVEKYIRSPRHIEMQVFADRFGNAVHLFERDCSLQRRHQKVMEEAPAPGMTDAVRDAMGKAAVDAALAVGYVGAGTVEFIADASHGLRPDGFFFMEMNTRLQVEHPVTEAITGLDLVEWQFRVAAGEKLPLAQQELAVHGHAVEARLYAEDPERGFLPSTGRLWALRFPEAEGVRVDTGVAEGDVVTPYYDPMIAKVIAHAPSRLAALDLLAQALEETVVAGPRTNVGFLKALCDAHGFRAGEFDTGFIDRNMDALGAAPRGPDLAAAAAGALALVRERQEGVREAARAAGGSGQGPWDVADAFQLSGPRRTGLPIVVEGERIEAALGWDAAGPMLDVPGAELTGQADFTLVTTDDGIIALASGRQTHVRLHDPLGVALDEGDSGGVVKSPMHGKVVAIFVVEGEAVEKGQRVAIVEAMKMEHALVAPRAGVVAEVLAEAGQQVAEGARLAVIGENG